MTFSPYALSLKTASVLLASALLVACGGGSDSNSGANVDLSNLNISAPAQVEITENGGELNSGVGLDLNTQYTITSNTSYSHKYFNYTAEEDGYVVVQAKYESLMNSIELEAEHQDVTLDNAYVEEAKTLTLVFKAEKNKEYDLSLATEGTSSGTLVIAKLNKATVGLAANERLVYATVTQTKNDCEPQSVGEKMSFSAVLNLVDGYYLDQINGGSEAKINSNGKQVSFSIKEEDSYYKYTAGVSLIIESNGAITGSSKEVETDKEFNEACTFESTLSGNIIL